MRQLIFRRAPILLQLERNLAYPSDILLLMTGELVKDPKLIEVLLSTGIDLPPQARENTWRLGFAKCAR